MRITGSQLRKIIKEELLREAGFGDLRVAEDRLQSEVDVQTAKDLTHLWFDFMTTELSAGGPLSGVGATKYILDGIHRIPSAYPLLEKIDGYQFKQRVAEMKPQLMSNFEEDFGSSLREMGVNTTLVEKEIKPLYMDWVNIMTQYAVYMVTLPDHNGEFLIMGKWSGIENLGSWLGQEFRRLGIPATKLSVKQVQNSFMVGIEPLTGLVKQSLYSVT